MSVSKIIRNNYAVGIKVHLYFNKDSHNRETDSTPRFYLQPVELLTIEKIAFTKEARHKGYVEAGQRLYRYKHAGEELTTAKTEEIYKDIKESHPYGYKENDPPTFAKYMLDVKYNTSFQAHYSRYWRNHLSLQKTPVVGEPEPHPYISFTTTELVTVKTPVGTVPALGEGLSPWAEYGTTRYEEPQLFSCHEHDINLYVRVPYLTENFYIGDYPTFGITVNSSGGEYSFHMKSGARSDSWPSGTPAGALPDGATFSGYKLSFSTGKDGTWGGFQDAEADGTEISVRRVVSPDVAIGSQGPWYLSVADKDSNHPYYGQGSTSGFTISGLQSPELTLKKGCTYFFTQTGESNEGHPLYLSTSAAGADTNIYSSGVVLTDVFPSGVPGYGTGEGTLVFKVPYDAPDTLYYQCKNHQYMGGELTLVDAVPASGAKPGETTVVTFNQQTEGWMYYYASDADVSLSHAKEKMGGLILLKKECAGVEVDL